MTIRRMCHHPAFLNTVHGGGFDGVGIEVGCVGRGEREHGPEVQ